jgi:fructokinase
LLERRLTEEGVDVSLVMRGSEPTALAIVGRTGDEPVYDFRWSDTADRSYDPARLPLDVFESLDAMHLGSAALGLDPVGARLLALMEQLTARCSCPSTRTSVAMSSMTGTSTWAGSVEPSSSPTL